MHIFIRTGNQQIETTLEQINNDLQLGALTAETPAWYDGISNWTTLRNVPGIVLVGQAPPAYTPPPLPASPTPPAPPAPPEPPALVQEGDGTGGVIPYKNPHALISYYLGIVGLLPVIGLLAAIPAIILGISGLRRKKENPIIKGSAHAWIGIILGVISIGYHVLTVVIILIASYS